MSPFDTPEMTLPTSNCLEGDTRRSNIPGAVTHPTPKTSDNVGHTRVTGLLFAVNIGAGRTTSFRRSRLIPILWRTADYNSEVFMTKYTTLVTSAFLVLTIGVPFAQQTTSAEPVVLADGASAKSKRVDGLHKVRYIELFLALPEMKAGRLVAAVYNTTFITTGIPASKDTAPQAWVEGLDFDKIKNEYGVKVASGRRVATIMRDESSNVYDKTGPGMRNYKP
jgi:preprotein translocase subunit SecG